MFGKLFTELTLKNSAQVIPQLLTFPESNDYSYLSQQILKATLIRPFALEAYADFVIRSMATDEANEILLSTLLDPNSGYPGSIVLTHILYKKGYFKQDRINDYIFDKYTNFSNYKARYLFCILAPLIRNRNKDVFDTQCHNFYMTYSYSGAGNIFTSFFQTFPSKTDNEIEEMIRDPYGEIGRAILDDDVDSIKDHITNVNGTIIPSFFMATDLGQQSPTYLQWAALCGAESTFNYLLENGADPQIHDRQGRSSLCYAAAGGNLNIIRRLSKLVHDNDHAKETAIEYENREVFESA